MYLITQLTVNITEENQFMVELFDWYFVPLVNVDGYEFSWRSERLWRKNRLENNENYDIQQKNAKISDSVFRFCLVSVFFRYIISVGKQVTLGNESLRNDFAIAFYTITLDKISNKVQ